jgi:hypothetical protein
MALLTGKKSEQRQMCVQGLTVVEKVALLSNYHQLIHQCGSKTIKKLSQWDAFGAVKQYAAVHMRGQDSA